MHNIDNNDNDGDDADIYTYYKIVYISSTLVISMNRKSSN